MSALLGDHSHERFEALALDDQIVRGATFDRCTFHRCTFSKTRFSDVQFADCVFEHWDLALKKTRIDGDTARSLLLCMGVVCPDLSVP